VIILRAGKIVTCTLRCVKTRFFDF
jgi:hypothetical protein